jgi:putative endonuclease
LRSHHYYVYIATNRRGTLYTGVSNDCERRVEEHRTGRSRFSANTASTSSSTSKWTADVWSAIQREKQIKGWTTEKKLVLIRAVNPAMRDLLSRTKGRRVRKAPLPRRAVGEAVECPGGSFTGERPV